MTAGAFTGDAGDARPTAPLPPAKAVFFDVGETLVYPHPSSPEIISRLCREAGTDVTPAQVEAAESVVAPRMLERQSSGELYSLSMESSRRFWTWVYAQILEELRVPEAQREHLGERFHTHFNTLETWQLYPDAIPVLEALQERRHAGLVLGIISNWEDWLDSLLAQLQIDRYFDFAIISAGVRLEKPDPAIFQAALERAGVGPAEAVHIGDSLHADARGARGVGIAPVLLDRRRRYGPDRAADLEGITVIHALDELLPLLK